MPRISHLLLAVSFGFWLPVLAHSEEADPKSAVDTTRFDTEHIFGFAEGSDIGAKGELEIESVTVGSFGALGSYANIGNETSLRYGVTNELRFSIGRLTDYFKVHSVPSLSDRSVPEFSGLIADVRWHILDWRNAPFGMSFSINPPWRGTDELSGQSSGNYAVPVTLLVDKEVVPEKFFAVLNLIYQPSFLRPNNKWEHDDSFIIIAGGSYAISPSILVGAEIRHENSGKKGNFDAHALYIGPQLFVRLGSEFSAKLAWAAQIPDAAAHHLDLTNYQRHQVELQFAYSF